MDIKSKTDIVLHNIPAFAYLHHTWNFILYEWQKSAGFCEKSAGELCAKSVEEIEIEDGRLEVDNDFYSVEKGIYLSLYDESGYFLYGKVPYGIENAYGLEDGTMREIKENKQKWYLYDVLYRLENGQNVYVRGMASINDAEESFQITMRFAVILLPLFTLAAAFWVISLRKGHCSR